MALTVGGNWRLSGSYLQGTGVSMSNELKVFTVFLQKTALQSTMNHLLRWRFECLQEQWHKEVFTARRLINGVSSFFLFAYGVYQTLFYSFEWFKYEFLATVLQQSNGRSFLFVTLPAVDTFCKPKKFTHAHEWPGPYTSVQNGALCALFVETKK